MAITNAPASWSLADGDNLDRYFALTEAQQADLHGWFRLHGVDEKDVPLMARFELDEATREWLIPVHLRRDGVRYVAEDGEVAEAVLRRPWQADPPTLDPDPDALAAVKAARAAMRSEEDWVAHATSADATLDRIDQALTYYSEAAGGEVTSVQRGKSTGWAEGEASP